MMRNPGYHPSHSAGNQKSANAGREPAEESVTSNCLASESDKELVAGRILDQ